MCCRCMYFVLALLGWIQTGANTKKRMKLEDIHEAWGKHATTTSSDENNDNNINNNGGPFDDRIGRGGAATDTNNNSSCILLLPPFLRAFTALARIKYYGDDSPQEESDHGGSVNRLLLRDVFDNITKPTVSDIGFKLTLYPIIIYFVDSSTALLFCSFGCVAQNGTTSGRWVLWCKCLLSVFF